VERREEPLPGERARFLGETGNSNTSGVANPDDSATRRDAHERSLRKEGAMRGRRAASWIGEQPYLNRHTNTTGT
jgi:hypothetical protein